MLSVRRVLCAAAFFIAALAVFVPRARAYITQSINYQGFLTNKTSGLPIDAAVNMQFVIYNVPTGGTALFTDQRCPIQVSKGRYEVFIGSNSGGVPMSVLLSATSTYLEVQVNQASCGSFEVLSPRIKLQASPYSLITGGMPVTYSSVTIADLNTGGSGDPYSLGVTTDATLSGFHLYVATTGFVGLGNKTPLSKLHVLSGDIRVQSGNILTTGGVASIDTLTIADGTLVAQSSTTSGGTAVLRIADNGGTNILRVQQDHTSIFVSSVSVQGLVIMGAFNQATVRTLACPSGTCMLYDSTDNDLYTSTGTGVDQWRNTRTGLGP